MIAVVIAILAAIGLLAAVFFAAAVNALFPTRTEQVKTQPPITIATPKTLDPVILRGLKKKGFTEEQVESLFAAGRLVISPSHAVSG
jgi:hypothetical protein